jgi:phosphoribosylanthranilate isomerase
MMWNPGSVRAFLIDSGNSLKPGGTGEVFDWTAAVAVVDEIKRLFKVVVAGGLTPQNVGEAIGILQPWGVDIASGVEAASGKKDPEKVRAFVRAVREIDGKVG